MIFLRNFAFRNLVVTLILFIWSGTLWAQVRICSWNIQHMGKSKSEAEIRFIAKTLKDFDVVAIQEVVAGPGGSQAVARLGAELNRKGTKWDYIISDPTNSSNSYASERYAYLWKTATVNGVRKAWLQRKFEQQIDREPFLMDFCYKGRGFTLVNFHAIPKSKQPETEIKYFRNFPGLYKDRNLLFLGDFNLPQSHTVFNPLKKMGYEPALVDQRTTMKMKCISGTCLASEYDNIFYRRTGVDLIRSGAILIYQSFPDMRAVRKISDHIPIWMEFEPRGVANRCLGVISRAQNRSCEAENMISG